MDTGIYLIKNTITNQIYVGSTSSSFRKRFHQHFNSLKHNKHHNKHFQSSYNKYGKENFCFIILELCEKEKCIEREQYYIDTLLPEYNKSPTAGSMLGNKLSEETKEKISKANKGKTGHKLGQKLSEETKKRLSESKKGKSLSEDHKKKAIENLKKVDNSKKIAEHRKAVCKKVICINDGKIFESGTDASNYYKINRGNLHTAMKENKSIKKFKFEYVK